MVVMVPTAPARPMIVQVRWAAVQSAGVEAATSVFPPQG